jgi:hypothetical protein
LDLQLLDERRPIAAAKLRRDLGFAAPVSG